jgi:hypothetical protein
LQLALAKLIGSNLAKANSEASSYHRLKATAIDVVTHPQCTIEFLNDAVSDTTGVDSSNAVDYIIITVI